MTQKSSTYDRQTFQETFENEFTHLNGFLRNVRRFAESPALTCPVRERTWTYSDLNRECSEHCGRHPMLARYKKPRYYRFVEELPCTATGKKYTTK